jgi:hypothetical protein
VADCAIRSGSKPNPPLPRFVPSSPYVVLRLDPSAGAWLAAARLRGFEAPDPIRALLAGRSRVEVGRDEAELALAWAARLPGWNDDARPPLFIHTPGEILVES